MKPIPFKEANLKLGAPKSMPECSELPVYSDARMCISKWSLTQEEIAEIQRTGNLWLIVWSDVTQPPVSIVAKSPFTPQPQGGS